jgi:hypothetical protein
MKKFLAMVALVVYNSCKVGLKPNCAEADVFALKKRKLVKWVVSFVVQTLFNTALIGGGDVLSSRLQLAGVPS